MNKIGVSEYLLQTHKLTEEYGQTKLKMVVSSGLNFNNENVS